MFPQERTGSGCEWGRQFLRLPGSSLSQNYDPDLTPWSREPAEAAIVDSTVRIVTFVKPIQSGGSTIGELAACYWIANESNGDIQWNWENDEKAKLRWKKRISKMLEANEEVQRLWPTDGTEAGLVTFPHLNLIVQGSFAKGALDSDSIRFQINEEVHNWEKGKLSQAYDRTAAYWSKKILNVSNASVFEDQLHKAFVAGTQQHWEVRCPGCGEFHRMHMEWKDGTAGGLRYDSSAAKKPDGSYDYNLLRPTIRYEFECGHAIPDDVNIRRRLSMSGRYSEPTNRGALLSNRSYTLEAVSVHYIRWIDLIQQKHEALRALRFGNHEPWQFYIQRRECKFWNPLDRPVQKKITVNVNLKKSRDGIAPDKRQFRGAALDFQQGEMAKGEFPHYWCVIRDFDPAGNSLLVFEGKLLTDADAAAVIKDHVVRPRNVVVDSGHNAKDIYQFCLQHGFNAIKGAAQAFFTHSNGSRRIWSEEKPLHLMVNAPRTHRSAMDEPMFFHYSKSGIRDRLSSLMASKETTFGIPGDVSDDYRKHMESEELRTRRTGTGEVVSEWVQLLDRNDLRVCECYLALLAEMAGCIPAIIYEQQEKA